MVDGDLERFELFATGDGGFATIPLAIGAAGVVGDHGVPGGVVIASRGTERAGVLTLEKGQVIFLVGKPPEHQAAGWNRELDPLRGEEHVVSCDHAFEKRDSLGGLDFGVLVEQENVRAGCDGRFDTEGLAKLSHFGLGARTVQLIKNGHHPGGLEVLGVQFVKLAELGDRLGCQSILDGPPGRRVAGREPYGLGLLKSLTPLALGSEARNQLEEVIPAKLVLAVGKLDEDLFPLDRDRGLDLAAFLKIGQVSVRV